MVFVVGVRRRDVLGEVALASAGRMLASVGAEVMVCGFVRSKDTASTRLCSCPHVESSSVRRRALSKDYSKQQQRISVDQYRGISDESM